MKFRFDRYTLEAGKMEFTCDGKVQKLEPQVFALLALLVRHHDRVVTKQEINDVVWGGRVVSEGALNSRIRSVRKAVGDDGKTQRLIKTIPNIGFKFAGEAELVSPNEMTTDELKTLVSDYTRENPKASNKNVWVIAGLGFAAIIAAGLFVFGPSKKPKPETQTEDAALAVDEVFAIVDYKIGDVIQGGKGIDTLDLSGYTSGGFFVGLHGEMARDLIYKKGDGEYTIVSFENVIGTAQNDSIRGSIEPNIIWGGAGDDILESYGRADTIYGGEGDDYLNGGYGLDTIYGEDGDDRIVIATISEGDNVHGGAGIDTLDLTKFEHSGYTVDLARGFLVEKIDRGYGKTEITGIERIEGTPLDDTFTGDEYNNHFKGGPGNDEIDGGDGEDTKIFTNPIDNYEVTTAENGITIVTDKTGRDGVDTLKNIETLIFSDAELNINQLQ